MIQSVKTILWTVWAAALDAKVMIDEEGASEAIYLKKQENHFDKAAKDLKAALLAEMPEKLELSSKHIEYQDGHNDSLAACIDVVNKFFGEEK